VKVLIFAGTTEGRELHAELKKWGIDCRACVATEYGKRLLDGAQNVISGRLNARQMSALIKDDGFDIVVDATHPYATEVTENIAQACADSGCEYIRLLRHNSNSEDARRFDSLEEAVHYLNAMEGIVLSAIGSKELGKLKQLRGYAERVVARILPDAEAVAKCMDMGFKKLICMQGPFTKEMNTAIIRQYGCSFLLTKDSGTQGGLEQKLEAAKEAGAEPLVIARPTEEQGMTLSSVIQCIKSRVKITKKRVFPLFVDIGGKRVIIVGGGAVAARRIKTLHDFGCEVLVVSPTVSPDIAKLIESGDITCRQKRFDFSDLHGAFLVVVATDDRELNKKIGEWAHDKGIYASIADAKDECSVFFPAVVHCEGGVTVGIAGSGENHKAVSRLAQRIREIV